MRAYKCHQQAQTLKDACTRSVSDIDSCEVIPPRQLPELLHGAQRQKAVVASHASEIDRPVWPMHTAETGVTTQ